MKKVLSGLLVLGLCGTLCACAANNSAQTNNTEETTVEQSTGTNVVNPISEVSKEDFAKSVGVDLGVPEGASEVKYLVYGMDGNMDLLGEVQFTVDGVTYCQRVMSTSKLSMDEMDADYLQSFTGLYYDWSKAQDVEIGSCKGKTLDDEGCKAVVWLDAVPGLVYSVSTNGDNVSIDQVVRIATENFTPVQGNN